MFRRNLGFENSPFKKGNPNGGEELQVDNEGIFGEALVGEDLVQAMGENAFLIVESGSEGPEEDVGDNAEVRRIGENLVNRILQGKVSVPPAVRTLLLVCALGGATGCATGRGVESEPFPRAGITLHQKENPKSVTEINRVEFKGKDDVSAESNPVDIGVPETVVDYDNFKPEMVRVEGEMSKFFAKYEEKFGSDAKKNLFGRWLKEAGFESGEGASISGSIYESGRIAGFVKKITEIVITNGSRFSSIRGAAIKDPLDMVENLSVMYSTEVEEVEGGMLYDSNFDKAPGITKVLLAKWVNKEGLQGPISWAVKEVGQMSGVYLFSLVAVDKDGNHHKATGTTQNVPGVNRVTMARLSAGLEVSLGLVEDRRK